MNKKNSISFILCMLTMILILANPAIGSVYRVPMDFLSIQGAIDASSDGDTVLVADGVYTSTTSDVINFNGKAILVASENGPGHCILNGDDSRRCVGFYADETHDSILKGFWIKHGVGSEGAGIYCWESSPLIMDCIITDCNALWDGAGFASWKSEAIISNCIIKHNAAVAEVDNCFGGGVSAWVSAITMVNCIITDNTATGLEYPNATQAFSAGVFFDPIRNFLHPNQMINCVITNNRILDFGDGGGIGSNHFSRAINCIVWGNSPNPQVSGFEVTYSCIQDGHNGIGNTTADPLFVSGPLGNFYLSQISAGQAVDSPCIDSGSDLASAICYNSDLEPICLDSLTTASSGIQDEGIVDLGYHYYTRYTPEPTATPTPTIAPTTAPSMTPTAVPDIDLHLSLWMPSHVFHPGDTCACTVSIINSGHNSIPSIPLFTVLSIGDSYYFWPDYSDFAYKILDEVSVGRMDIEIVPEFIWPSNSGSFDNVVWYSVLANPEITEFISNLDEWRFSWDE